MLEIRGIGIIDVAKMFGASALLPSAPIDLVVSLEKFDLLTPLSLTVFLLLWTLPVLLMSDWTARY